MTIIKVTQEKAERIFSYMSKEVAYKTLCDILQETAGIKISPEIFYKEWEEGKMLVKRNEDIEVWAQKMPIALHFHTESNDLELIYREDIQALIKRGGEKEVEFLVTADM